MEEVAVRVVDLDGIEAGLEGTLDTRSKGSLKVLNILLRHLFWHGVSVIVRDCAGRIDIIGPAIELQEV